MKIIYSQIKSLITNLITLMFTNFKLSLATVTDIFKWVQTTHIRYQNLRMI